MQTKVINYKRILNLGNYESKHLEISVEIHEGDDVEGEISHLMERVERKIREEAHKQVELEIKEQKVALRQLKQECEALKSTIQPPVAEGQDTVPDNNPF